MFPKTFQAPRLCHLLLISLALPIESRLLTAAMGLVTFSLVMIQPSTYFQPNVLLQWLSFPVPSLDMGLEPTHTPVTTPITLLNHRLFCFECDGAYLEEVVCWITTPHLKQLEIELLNDLTFSVPCLLNFIDTPKNPRFDSAKFIFSDGQVHVKRSLHNFKMYAICILVTCCHVDRQVSSVAQIFNMFGKVFTMVVHLTLKRSWPS